MNNNLQIVEIVYGTNFTNIDITSKVKNLFLKNDELIISKEINLNEVFQDPCFGHEKEIKIIYSINNEYSSICEKEKHNYLSNDIILKNCKIENCKNENFTNQKEEFRFLLFSNLNYIRNINLPIFCENSFYESVLIEYRLFPHLEFLIRNTIIKLGEKWCHTIICGNLNYNFMVNMCSAISNKIKVINSNHDNLNPSEYSNFLSNLNFWDLLNGEKILIYQEDSIIFKDNIEDFLHFDYIGAPWPENQNDNRTGVGNGGISLRSKSIMKQIINKISISDTVFNSDTKKYIKDTNSSFPPEDVYFSKNMEDFNIGLLADRNSASNFSTESILNNNSFAGHNFWSSDQNWKNRIFENNIIQFIPSYDMSFLEHRGGWTTVLNSLINNNFYKNNSKIHFFDILESKFLWNTEYKCLDKWSGILHCTPKTPPFWEFVNISNLFKNVNFIESLKSCVSIFTLSSYITNFLKNKFQELHLEIKIYTLKHPVDENNIKLFNFNDYTCNNEKAVIQIGKQLRKVTSIYLLDSLNFKKIWLTGTKSIGFCIELIDKEVKYLNIDTNNFKNSVEMKYIQNEEEYDDYLSKNIVFIDLFDAAANNTVVECIVRNTPIIVNKMEQVVEYLGEDYPLYFENMNEVSSILKNNELILKAHNHLVNMDKTDLSMDYFTKQLFTILNKDF